MRSLNILRTSNDSNLVVMFCEKSELCKFLLLLLYNVCSNAMLYLPKNFHEDILQEALETNYFPKKSQDLIDQKAKRYNFTLLFNKLT